MNWDTSYAAGPEIRQCSVHWPIQILPRRIRLFFLYMKVYIFRIQNLESVIPAWVDPQSLPVILAGHRSADPSRRVQKFAFVKPSRPVFSLCVNIPRLAQFNIVGTDSNKRISHDSHSAIVLLSEILNAESKMPAVQFAGRIGIVDHLENRWAAS
jgi:hypothetical protein